VVLDLQSSSAPGLNLVELKESKMFILREMGELIDDEDTLVKIFAYE
jgi:hypothetical protein